MRAIIVGLGGWGSSWAQVINDSADWEIVGLVDANPNAVENAASNLGIDSAQGFGALEGALRGVSADATFIFTPPIGRLQTITTAMDAGLHVLAEKPLADSLDDSLELLRRHRSSDRKLMVSQNYRYFPSSMHIRKAIASGTMGKPGYMNVLYHMAVNMPGSHLERMRHPFLLAMCIHHLDTMRYLLGCEPEWIRAESWNPSWSWLKADSCVSSTMVFPGDIRVNYFAGWATHRNETDWYGRWRLEFERGAIEADGVNTYEMRGSERILIPGPAIDARHTRGDMLQEFTAAIREDRTPECSIEDNIKTLLMAFAIIESAETSERIDFRSFAEGKGVDLQ